MDYKIKNPKILGDVIGLYSVAEAQAKRIGFASGKLNEPAYNAALQKWVGQIASDAKNGSLITSDHQGIRTPVDSLMAEFKVGNGGRFMSEDENLNITTCCYVLLYDLNAWASSRGDHYTVTHDGWWIDESGIIDPTRQELAGLPAPAGAVDEPAPPTSAAHQPTWKVKKPLRNSGYNWLLYRLLNEAHGAGLPRPTARDVLEKWRCNKPDEITEVLSDEFKYLDSNGDTQAADLDAIRKAIGRMTSDR